MIPIMIVFLMYLMPLGLYAQETIEDTPPPKPVKKAVKPRVSTGNIQKVKAKSAQVPSSSMDTVPMQIHMVDDFEDGTIETNPEWWTFGNLVANVIDNYPSPDYPLLGERSLHLQGRTTDWYVGGLGTYLGLDGTLYNGIKMVVWGKGEDSGVITIELYDDDNGTRQIESYAKTDVLKFDDKFVYTLKVDWAGWKSVTIPFKNFWDANPNIGDGAWNPNRNNGSGGLVQMQMILMTPNRKGDVDIRIDSVSLINALHIKLPNSENFLDYQPQANQKLE